MTISKCRFCCAIFLALTVVSAAALAAGPDEGLAARSKWFDFEAYKVAYGKSYSSLTEELMRRKYFLARAFRAFVSSSKYKLGLSPYYLAVNHMSDWSPKELVARLYKGATIMTTEDQFLSAKVRRVEVSGDPEVNATLSRRKRQVGVEWERPGTVVWDDLEEVRQSMEAELGQFDPVGRFGGRGANKNLAMQMMTVRLPKQLMNGDIVFVDHRDSGCLTEVRNQGECGSCYAIALLGMLEWIYCMKTGRQIEFSEQYVVDCGRPLGLEGCVKGTLGGVANFINNVGLELRQDYPYQAREERCPYDDQLHPYVVRGSHRVQFRKSYAFRRKMLPAMVALSPVAVRLIFLPGSSIHQYGGGVLTEGDCSDEARGHHALVVGHGAEGGREYWLIKNSYGPDWGEAGYLKLDKNLAEWCTEDGGAVVGTNLNGVIEAQFYDNHLNQGQVAALLMDNNPEIDRERELEREREREREGEREGESERRRPRRRWWFGYFK